MTNHTWIRCAFRRGVAGAVSFCLVCTGLPNHAPAPVRAGTHIRVQNAAEPAPQPAGDRFLRDAIPAAVTVSDPPDTIDDGFTLPDEKSKKQLTREIVMWVVVAAFVAYFIVKVFIEKDDQASDSGNNGKPITPPQ